MCFNDRKEKCVICHWRPCLTNSLICQTCQEKYEEKRINHVTGSPHKGPEHYINNIIISTVNGEIQ